MNGKKFVADIGLLVMLSLLVLSGCGPVGTLLSQAAPPAAAQSVEEIPQAPAVSPPDTGTLTQGNVLGELEKALSAIYEDVNPSVVSVLVVQRVSGASEPLPFFNPLTPEMPEEGFRQGSGSGFVWDTDGHIVTNNHVVEGADKVSVRFADGTIVPAEVVGTDRDSDIAVLNVDVPQKRLHPVTIADGNNVRVGELAVAIGSPFGLENTMTVGFVSALERSLPVDAEMAGGPTYTIPDIIQTDAPINPGNSGGVLVNEEGKVIGVTSAIISPVRASAGIGFAIPAKIVENVVPALIEAGHYTHAWLGLSGTSLTPDIAKAMALDANQRGALVIEVLPDSPSAAAGLHGSDDKITVDGQTLPVGGDVIVALEGAPVQTFDDLVAELARYSAGEKVTLTILRAGKTQDVQVTLGERPANNARPTVTPKEEAPAGPAWLGLKAMSVNSEIAQAMDLPEDQAGVLVGQVQVGSPAEKAGLRGSDKLVTINGQEIVVGGDVIIAWNDEPVTGMRQLQEAVSQSAPGDKVTLTVLRNGRQKDLRVTLGARPTP